MLYDYGWKWNKRNRETKREEIATKTERDGEKEDERKKERKTDRTQQRKDGR